MVANALATPCKRLNRPFSANKLRVFTVMALAFLLTASSFTASLKSRNAKSLFDHNSNLNNSSPFNNNIDNFEKNLHRKDLNTVSCQPYLI
jgi:hypothetical protein